MAETPKPSGDNPNAEPGVREPKQGLGKPPEGDEDYEYVAQSEPMQAAPRKVAKKAAEIRHADKPKPEEKE